jgi:5-methylcytosine-specific restriction endonuclease McrBC regulatory subunit McrC
MFISLKDNQHNKTVPWNEAWKDYDVDGQIVAAESPPYEQFKVTLKKFSGVSLTELRNPKNKEKYGKFIVFPSDAAESDLDDDEKVLFELLDADSDNPKFRTGNVMGFFSLRGEKKENDQTSEVWMQITSRFDDAERKDNFFLHYMLQKVCNMAIAPSVSSGADSFYDFLPYLFPGYLKEACKQGIFRAYVTCEYNDAYVRGPIDVARHIRYNIPFNGKVAYHTREYTADNKITQLVRHTIEYIRSMGFSILDGDARDDVGKIIAATPSYTKNDRAKVIAQNLRPVTHPYYTAYEPLRTLCLGILRHDKLSYGSDEENQIAGILFDGANLWEEYLAKVFEDGDLGLIHSNNRMDKNGLYLYKGSKTKCYPDFYCEPTDNAIDGVVVDAKYKRLCTTADEKDEADRSQDEYVESGSDKKPTFHYRKDDLYQMIIYMYRLRAPRALLVSPCKSKMDNLKVQCSSTPKKANGYGGEVHVVAAPIPINLKDDWEKYKKLMDETEKSLVEAIRSYMQNK